MYEKRATIRSPGLKTASRGLLRNVLISSTDLKTRWISLPSTVNVLSSEMFLRTAFILIIPVLSAKDVRSSTSWPAEIIREDDASVTFRLLAFQ